jgi:hypothetical protein
MVIEVSSSLQFVLVSAFVKLEIVNINFSSCVYFALADQ